MSESMGARAYEAIFEGNGDSLMTRVKVLETKMDLWHGIAVKLLIGSIISLVGNFGQLLYHLVAK